MTAFFEHHEFCLRRVTFVLDGPERKCYTVVSTRQNKHRNADLLQIAPKIEISQLTRDQKVAVFARHRAIDIVIFGTSNDLGYIRRVVKQWKRGGNIANCLGLLATTAVALGANVLNLFPHLW